MNEDRFNMDIRKFLKIVGVTSQREVETAVRDALAKGKLGESALLGFIGWLRSGALALWTLMRQEKD